MSYCRWSPTSDVYVIDSDSGWECVGCCAVGHTVVYPSPFEMAVHLGLHAGAGDKVPPDVVPRLRHEQRALDAGWPAEQLWRLPDPLPLQPHVQPGVFGSWGEVARLLVVLALMIGTMGFVVWALFQLAFAIGLMDR